MELSRFPRVAEESAHGRFQPFHNEHLEYVLAAQGLCDFLWIGITKYDVTSTDLNPLGAVRERPENNPLTFFERAQIIRGSLIEAGVSAECIRLRSVPHRSSPAIAQLHGNQRPVLHHDMRAVE